MGLSLNDINSEVDAQYRPFMVDDVPGGEVVLRSPLRLSKEARSGFKGLNTKIREAQAEGDLDALVSLAGEVVRTVAEGDGGDRLLDALGDDPAKLMFVLEKYMEVAMPGEASPSGS